VPQVLLGAGVADAEHELGAARADGLHARRDEARGKDFGLGGSVRARGHVEFVVEAQELLRHVEGNAGIFAEVNL